MNPSEKNLRSKSIAFAGKGWDSDSRWWIWWSSNGGSQATGPWGWVRWSTSTTKSTRMLTNITGFWKIKSKFFQKISDFIVENPRKLSHSRWKSNSTKSKKGRCKGKSKNWKWSWGIRARPWLDRGRCKDWGQKINPWISIMNHWGSSSPSTGAVRTSKVNTSRLSISGMKIFDSKIFWYVNNTTKIRYFLGRPTRLKS